MSGSRPLGLVIGATHDPGRGVARQFAENGFDLVIVDATTTVHVVADELRALGATVTPVDSDLLSHRNVAAVRDALHRMDGVVAAAAFTAVGRLQGGFLALEPEKQLDLIRRNCSAMVQLARLVAQDMAGEGTGEMLFLTADAAVEPQPGAAVYGATRAFLHSLFLSLREELAVHGITVTVLKERAD